MIPPRPPAAMTPDRARRELRHLMRLLDRQSWSDRMWATGRGMAAFGAAYLIAAKLLLLKTVAAKMLFGAAIALLAELPFLIGWLLAVLAMVLVVVSVVSIIAGEFVEPPSFPDAPCELCAERKRRQQLEAMIADREAVLRASER